MTKDFCLLLLSGGLPLIMYKSVSHLVAEAQIVRFSAMSTTY